MPRIKPSCVRRVSIGDSSGSCSDEEGSHMNDHRSERIEAHMCPRCHEQFQTLHDFLHHKRICDEKALQMGEDRMHSDPEDMVVSGDEEMDDNTDTGKRIEEVRRHRQDAENNNSLDDGDGPDSDIPSVAFPFPAASHVTLEALQNTKVAVAQVAQFAATAMANNVDNEAALQELAVLQSTLFTLQHQQVFQLQLIQQLQNQLSLTRPTKDECRISPPLEVSKPSPPPIRPPSITRSPTPSPTKTEVRTRESTPVRQEPVAPPTTQSIPAYNSNINPLPQVKPEPLNVPKPPLSSPSTMTHPLYSSISSSLASSIITNNDPPPSLNEPNSLEMLQKRAQEVLDNASQGLLANNLADELAFRKSGKMSPYDGKSGGRNEPFFKHRCRYCGKVFGSDSALQIHIRSHTGERPFKCNVCGSRFTTKGNLKVHFQRHTSKFPHVKMNPNPIPEHLDKYHPPLLSQLSPGPMPVMPTHPLQFTPGGPPPFPPGLALYRPVHHDILAPRLNEKQVAPHLMFSMRDEQETPADLSKPTSNSPIQIETETRCKSEPRDEEPLRESSFEESERISPKREIEEGDGGAQDIEPDRYSPSPFDECSTDSKYSNEERLGSESPHAIADPDQPENLSSKILSISGPLPTTTENHPAPLSRPYPKSFSTSSSGDIPSPFSFQQTFSFDRNKDSIMFSPMSSHSNNNDHSWENFIEIDKSDSGKLQELVDPDNKTSDPNECLVCHRVLSCKSALQMHYRTHTGERPFRCRLCGRAFTTKGNLKTHMGVHRIKTPTRLHHQCPVCHKKFTNSPVLQQHIRLHTGEPTDLTVDQIKAAEIDDMPYGNRFPFRYISSRRFPTPDYPLQNYPGDRRADSRATDDYNNIMWDGRESADRELTSDSDSKDCRLSTDNTIEAIDCMTPEISAQGSEGTRSILEPTSPSSQTSPRPPARRSPHPMIALTAHGAPPFSPLGIALGPTVRGNTTCNICFKTFACHSALEIHYRSHTKERPFKCNVCDRGFSTKGNMKQHMLTHKIRDGGSQYSTAPPSVTSADESRDSSEDNTPVPQQQPIEIKPEVVAVKRSPPATTEVPLPPKRPTVSVVPPPSQSVPQSALSSKHLCNVCRKNFSSSSALQIHMRTHTGDKPFRCAVCQKAFTTKGNLKVHMGTHMWSSGASRRGRRMSLELPPRPMQEPHELLRRPDLFYPYLPAPFLNGMQQKLNEMSVLQQQNGLGSKFPGLLGFGAFPPPLPRNISPPSESSSPPSIEESNRAREAALREMEARGRAAWELQYGAASRGRDTSAASEDHSPPLMTSTSRSEPLTV